ncbi:ABC transporter substrate-binding protein [Microbaculum marinum]|uniref:ABC transporter substrate-binding protein n=1 Tax=Microbaculum marinum TaxID=1764581 RepID=A0AAW9RS32_9HYPH
MRIGLLQPYSGPCAIWRIGGQACAALGACEPVAGRVEDDTPVELVPADCGYTLESATEAALYLRDVENVDLVVGMQPSHQRNAVSRALGGQVAYIYTPEYEGGWCGPGAIPIGVSGWEVLGPGVNWLHEKRKVRRWFFVGNDYLWPRAAHAAAVASIHASGAQLVGTSFLPFGTQTYDRLFREIRACRADGVIVVLLGEESVRFHRAFGEVGLARRIARFCLACDETLLWALDAGAAQNLYACQPYFWGVPSPERDSMIDRYKSAFGPAQPPVTSLTIGIYDGVRLARALGRVAERPDRASIARLVRNGFDRNSALRLLGFPAHGAGGYRLTLAVSDGHTFRPRLIA